MADFIHDTTYEIRKSVSEPDLDGKPGWHRLKDKAGTHYNLPSCDKKYWKDFPPVEMTVQEKADKDAADAAASFNARTYDQITTDIFNSFDGADLVKVSDSLDTAFDVSIRKRNWAFARSRMAKALQTNKITQAQYDIINSKIPE